MGLLLAYDIKAVRKNTTTKLSLKVSSSVVVLWAESQGDFMIKTK